MITDSNDKSGTPQSAQDIVDNWLARPSTPVLVIDETRRPLFGQPHKEFLIFTTICIPAGRLYSLMSDMEDLRNALPEAARQEDIKGKDLLHLANEVPEFQPLLSRLGEAAKAPTRAVFAATTIKNIHDSNAKVSITAMSETGRTSTVRGQELKVVLNLLRQLGPSLVNESNRIDVIIDRSAALGLDPKQRQLAEGQSESFWGQLVSGQGPTYSITSDSDQGVFRDALLLPDFVGYLLMNKSPNRLKSFMEAVMAPGGTPFYLQEIPLPGWVEAEGSE